MNPDAMRDKRARRRARKKGATHIEKIDRREVYARDGGLCAICGEHVPADSCTLDHITPLAAGGSHTYDNLAVAHARCNKAKGDGNTPTQRPLFSRLPTEAR